MVWSRIIGLMVGMLFASSSWAVTVLSIIKPIQMITHELVKNVATAEVLLDNNASPHDYALRPSDVKKINSADLVIWFGHGLEPFLEKILEQKKSDQVITISELSGIPLRKFADSHSHDGHDHGLYDPHFWLGANVVKMVAPYITQRLVAIDSSHAEMYQANLTVFLEQLNETDTKISEKLAQYQEYPYYVFHDAYGYFEENYQLNNIGYFTVSPERKPGAKTLVTIKKALSENKNICLFSEPQFKPSVIESVMRGTTARSGQLDPLATEITVADGSYFVFLLQLSRSFEQCFVGS